MSGSRLRSNNNGKDFLHNAGRENFIVTVGITSIAVSNWP
jgi:hypothetical protein